MKETHAESFTVYRKHLTEKWEPWSNPTDEKDAMRKCDAYRKGSPDRVFKIVKTTTTTMQSDYPY